MSGVISSSMTVFSIQNSMRSNGPRGSRRARHPSRSATARISASLRSSETVAWVAVAPLAFGSWRNAAWPFALGGYISVPVG
jgi:hypothetical protein